MEFSLSPGERRQLASLLAAVAITLFVLFGFTVVLPLLPPRPADPLWQLALCGGLCGSGVLALLAVLLVRLGAALDPEAVWLQRRRRWLAGACRGLSVAFLLLIPLQGWAAWQTLETASRAESRVTSQALARLADFRRAVSSAASVAALQTNLAAIQAPTLNREDQSLGLPAPKVSLLGQVLSAEQQIRRTGAPPSPESSSAEAGERTSRRRIGLAIDSLRVLLLALSLAMGFAAAAQRHGSTVSQLTEWRLAAGETIKSVQSWCQKRHAVRQRGRRGPGGGRDADADYFESLADQWEGDRPPPP